MRGRPNSSDRKFEDTYNYIDAKYLPREQLRLVGKTTATAVISQRDGQRTFQTLRLVVTRPHFGGVRHWYQCPRCQSQRRKLYVLDDGSGLGCRGCLRLVYFCQYNKGPLAGLRGMVRHRIGELEREAARLPLRP